MTIFLRITMLCSSVFFTKTSFGQSEDFMGQVQERIKQLVTKEYDSIIAYSFRYSYPPMPIPNAESLNKRSHSCDAFLVCFKNDSCFGICIAQYDSGIATSNRTLIQAEPEIIKLRQSWVKVKEEHFLPFTYKHTVDGKTSYDSVDALHPAYGNLTFKSKNYYKTEDFLPVVTAKKAWDWENINYDKNASLGLFAAYSSLIHLYDLLIGQFIYSK